jgi:uncharacterized protein YjbI with pentapeptide repeats
VLDMENIQEEKKEANELRAMIISISDYANNLPALDFCKNDGEEMYNLLKSLRYEIRDNNKLIGNVKFETMRSAIFEFFTSPAVRPDDTLLFYFSGHGVLDRNANTYFATSDIDPDKPLEKGIPFIFFNEVLQTSKSRKIVTILDCCYSGEAMIGKGGNDDEAATKARKDIENKITEGEGRYLLASSQGYQKSFSMVDKPYSAFTYLLLEGLRENERSIDSNGCVTPESLGKYIDKRIVELPGNAQRPIRKVEASGDIVLAYYPKLLKPKIDYLLKLLLDGKIKEFNKIREQKGYAAINFREVDLNGRNLKGIDLRSVDLTYANLQGANLQGANLEGANLTRSLLEGADLTGSSLKGANLRSSIVRSAKLIGADLGNVGLQESNIMLADLEGANLKGANLFRSFAMSANLRGANLEGANLTGSDLGGANLIGANFQRANLSYANLLEAELQGANLESAKIRETNFDVGRKIVSFDANSKE